MKHMMFIYVARIVLEEEIVDIIDFLQRESRITWTYNEHPAVQCRNIIK